MTNFEHQKYYMSDAELREYQRENARFRAMQKRAEFCSMTLGVALGVFAFFLLSYLIVAVFG